MDNNQTVEETTDIVVSYMAEFISDNTFLIGMDDIILQVTKLHEATIYSDEELFLWCRYNTKGS